MKIAHINIRSLLPCYQDIKHLLYSKAYDILALTETWLSPSIDEDALRINHYTLYRCDRDGRGGGVAFYVHEKLKCNLLDSDSDIEQLWLSVKVSAKKLFLESYIGPQISIISFLLTNLKNPIPEC